MPRIWGHSLLQLSNHAGVPLRRMGDSLSKLRSMLALLSPNWLKALHLYMPPSSRLGFLMVSVSTYLFFFSGQHLQTKSLLGYPQLFCTVEENAAEILSMILLCLAWSFDIAYSYRIRLFSLMDLSPLNHEISGMGLASRRHSMMRLSPSCLIVGFLGKRGGMPSGMRGLLPRSLPEMRVGNQPRGGQFSALQLLYLLPDKS